MPLQADQQPRAFCLFLRLKGQTQVPIGQVVSVVAKVVSVVAEQPARGENTGGEALKKHELTPLV